MKQETSGEPKLRRCLTLPRPLVRTVAVLCYLGAMRVPVVALMLPEWAYTVPSGLLVAAGAWLYGRRHSPFLLHHAKQGLNWSLQANLLLDAVSLLSKGCYYLWLYTGWSGAGTTWQGMATVFRWAGVLVSVLTVFVMRKAFLGQVGDPLSFAPETAEAPEAPGGPS